MGTFSATVKQFTIDAKENTSLIFREAADKLAKEVIRTKSNGGFLPHDTGNLGRSFAASTTDMPQINQAEAEYGAVNTEFVIAGVDAGDTLYMGFQAAYAARANYGFIGTDSLGRTYNQTGNYFVENAAFKWQQFVSEAEVLYGS